MHVQGAIDQVEQRINIIGDLVEFLLAILAVGRKLPEPPQISRDQRCRRMIIIQEGLIVGYNETAARVCELENLGPEASKRSLDFSSVRDQGFAVKKCVGRSEQKNAAAYQ
jgi:hypothetical protein